MPRRPQALAAPSPLPRIPLSPRAPAHRAPAHRAPAHRVPARLLSTLALAATLGLLAGSFVPATAVICATDHVPGATLLLPYFEVDLNNPNGLTTLFSINNASATAILTHVVVWSDLAVAVLAFDVYLTGFDVQTINLRDIIVYGNLPQTGSAGQDPTDTISPKGIFSQDINFTSCNGELPLPPLPAFFVSHLRNALTGLPSPVLANQCAGQNLGDNVARGYVTADTVNRCSTAYPGDPGYFAPNGTGTVTDQNVLWGSWYIINATKGYAEGSDMVAIEADGNNPATSSPGRYTFYGRYDGWTAVDHREPLATTLATQYADGGAFNGGTDLLVWRDSKVNQGPFPCPALANQNPPWYPMAQEGTVIFDEEEHGVIPGLCGEFPCLAPPPPFIPFPAAAQRVRVGSAALAVPFSFGWLYLDLNNTVASAGPNPPVDPAAQQAWVVATQSSNLRFAVALDAFRLDDACAANHFVP
ncbi:MAG TPA: hypothetical protein VMW75_17820 [Thermoanaerobaculia bacterium]|nr:hypothetical protein [Thermoanaerobaculia bacterium]